MLNSGDISSWVSCGWKGFALGMLFVPAVRTGDSLENPMSWNTGDFVNYVFFTIQQKLSCSWSAQDLFSLYLWEYARGETARSAVIVLLTSGVGRERSNAKFILRCPTRGLVVCLRDLLLMFTVCVRLKSFRAGEHTPNDKKEYGERIFVKKSAGLLIVMGSGLDCAVAAIKQLRINICDSTPVD